MDKNVHSGHRQRLSRIIERIGIENVSEVQAMEFILFYIFPRRDVNPLAHRLLNKFGSILDVLNASEEEIRKVNGMGQCTSKSLKLLSQVFSFYKQKKLSSISLEKMQDVADFFEELLRFETSEKFLVVGLDPAFRLITKQYINDGNFKEVGIDPMAIARFITSVKPAYILIAHNHPSGKASPSMQDIAATKQFATLVSSIGVTFADHIIVGEDGIYSMKKGMIISKFYDEENDKEFLKDDEEFVPTEKFNQAFEQLFANKAKSAPHEEVKESTPPEKVEAEQVATPEKANAAEEVAPTEKVNATEEVDEELIKEYERVRKFLPDDLIPEELKKHLKKPN